MVFDFDTVVDRRHTESIKWQKYRDKDIIPLWIADMDFKSPPAVVEAIKARADHGVFGYPTAPDALKEILVDHLQTDYDWRIEPGWIVWLPGLVTGIHLCCRATGRLGDEVLTAVPVYPPFLTAPDLSGRRLGTVPLMRREEKWTFDFQKLESAVSPNTRLFILCNPHNPVGRAFTHQELEKLAAFCRRHDIVICSDEIHNGLILDEDKHHIPVATIDPDAARRTITLMAPSKTYNIPGLSCSFAVIPDDALRKSFRKTMRDIVPEVNIMGYTAAIAAYRDGGQWLAEVKAYLRTNRDMVHRRINAIPGLHMDPVEATYLAWIDARSLGVENPAAFFENAGVGLSDGADFGAPGYLRLNFACPGKVLESALDRMTQAVEKIP